jgi:hypothetical protein
MPFSAALEASATRSGVEYAWERAHALDAVDTLAFAGLAVRHGELWLVVNRRITGSIPCTAGVPSIYHWECDREDGEAWSAFVPRCAQMAREAILDMPQEGEVALPPGGTIVYNLFWTAEHDAFGRGPGR